jgi:hypothetical protein
MTAQSVVISLELPVDLYQALRDEAQRDDGGRPLDVAIVATLRAHVTSRQRAARVSRLSAEIRERHGQLLRELTR